MAERLAHRSLRDPATGCILWTGSRNSDGYGYLCVRNKTWFAHRAAWMVAHGPIPSGLFVCHRCDVPACINPRHLFLGTHRQNMADRTAKHRRQRPRDRRDILRVFFRGEEIVGHVLHVRGAKRRPGGVSDKSS
jgi:hypothetical protein